MNEIELSRNYIPGGVHSPARSFPNLEVAPLYVERGEGAFLIDTQGRSFLDLCCGWGSLPFGHRAPHIEQAILEELHSGKPCGVCSPLEVIYAQCMQHAVPSMELLRCVTSGTEAVMSAIRVARGATGRSKIIKFDGGYHGHLDALLVRAGSGVAFCAEATSAGIATPTETLSLPWNDASTVCAIFKQYGPEIALVIVEPIQANRGVRIADPHFLHTLRAQTERYGALLLFDEIVTGFRCRPGSVIPEITPDLSCFGKIVGGGLPIGVFGGKRKYMECLAPLGNVYQAGTFAGYPLGLAAGHAAMRALTSEVYATLAQKMEILKSSLALPPDIHFVSAGSMGSFTTQDGHPLSLPVFRALFQMLFRAGVYLPPLPTEALFLSTAHDDEAIRRVGAIVSSHFAQRLQPK